MRLLRTLIVAAAMVCVATPIVTGQEKKTKEPAGKLRGQLPPNYGKLGLSDEQKQRIYGIQGKYRDQIDELQQKIDDMKDRQRKEMETVLTATQRTELRKIVAGKAPDGN